MALNPYYDRVRETTTTTGTGTITLAGAATGYTTFSSVLAVGESFTYCIAGGTEWEVGLGTLASSTTFTRDSILSSSNSGNVVTFSAGTKDVFITLPASQIALPSEIAVIASGNYMA